MGQLTVRLPAPHSAQARVTEEARRFNVLACGRRFGKTTLGIDRMVQPALHGAPCAWFAPSYKMLADAWREVEHALDAVITRKSVQEHRLELVGGGSLDMWSLDSPDIARGRKYKLVAIDEAALVKDLQTVWQQVIRPTLTDLRGGAWFLSTPRGMNYFKRLFDLGQDPTREEWASWQMPTASNPFIEATEIEAARVDMSEAAFNQEYLALFVNWEGAVFRRILEVATAEPQTGPVEGHSYIIGVDWGKTVDYTVFVVIDMTTKAMVAMDRSNQVDYVVQRGRLQALYEQWKPQLIIAEANSAGGPVIEQLRRENLPVRPFNTTNASKALAIEALTLAFERNELQILRDPILVSELQAYQAETLPSGLLRYGAPAGQHDDTVMALAMAWQGVVDRVMPNIRLIDRTDSKQAHDYYSPKNIAATFGQLRFLKDGGWV